MSREIFTQKRKYRANLSKKAQGFMALNASQIAVYRL
jgi:hypothetical protein